MGMQVGEFSEGIVMLTVSGTLTEPELARAQQEMADTIRTHGKVRILVLAGDFSGWERGGDWDDFSFQQEFDQYIEKMAIVGDTRWEDLALIFVGQGLRGFPIEYFESAGLERARDWLRQAP
jgi:hypothetical protein